MGYNFLGLEAEWWAIIISSFALIIAVFKDYIHPWIFSPKLKLSGKNEIFYIEEAENLTKKRYLRLKIENSESFFTSTAKNCYAKLIWIKKDGGLMHPFTQTILKWSIYDEEKEPITKRKHNLAKGESHFIDLCHEAENGKRILLFQTPIPPTLADKLIHGRYKFEIGIFGDNFNPKYQTIDVQFTNEFEGLKFI